jgi:hypothetical protein
MRAEQNDTRHYDILHNGIWHNDTWNDDTWYNNVWSSDIWHYDARTTTLSIMAELLHSVEVYMFSCNWVFQ